jgi:uncharacterized delta-60 repeat protein
MKKIKKSKGGLLTTGLVFILLCFSIQFEDINLSMHNETLGKKSITPNLSNGKSCSLEWYRTWGGKYNDDGYGVVVDSSDNVYLAGTTGNFGAGYDDMVLVKYNGNGTQQWNCTWGGFITDHGYGVVVDSSDNLYVVGVTLSFGMGDSDIFLVKYDGNGVQLWNSTWGEVDRQDIVCEVAIDLSDNVYLGGSTGDPDIDYDMVLIKYDQNGIQLWNRTWSGADWVNAKGLAMDSLDNVYLIGYINTFGAGEDEIVLVKYNVNGMQQWNRTWEGENVYVPSEMAVDTSDNVYVAGYRRSPESDIDIVLVKYNGNGTQQWYRIWDGGDYDFASGITVDSLDNVYLTGKTNIPTKGYQMVLIKYDKNGMRELNCIWGGVGSDYGEGIIVDSSGNSYIVGSTYSYGAGDNDIVLVKYGIAERPPSDELIMILIIVVSIASAIGVGIVITYFIRKRRKIIE